MTGWLAYVYAGFLFVFVPGATWLCIQIYRDIKRMKRFTDAMQEQTAEIEQLTARIREETRRREDDSP